MFIPTISFEEETYVRILEDINKLLHQYKKTQWNPKIIYCDYESGLKNAIKEVFPNCEVRLCYFHYTQRVMKKIRDLNLINKNIDIELYNHTDDFLVYFIINLLLKLPFLPHDENLTAFTDIMRFFTNVTS